MCSNEVFVVIFSLKNFCDHIFDNFNIKIKNKFYLIPEINWKL